ncbi:Mdm33 family-domain-containing protein [Pelagophyceae sp. CCMP2097]|nr:Mdm33 family-domain-containing protein [Pelagophyceae sp. CCMP2097]
MRRIASRAVARQLASRAVARHLGGRAGLSTAAPPPELSAAAAPELSTTAAPQPSRSEDFFRVVLAPIWTVVSDAAGLRELASLKEVVVSSEAAAERCLKDRTQAILAHDALVGSRGAAQAELSALLQRREAWDANDVSAFTALTTSEHGSRAHHAASLEARAAAELAADSAQRGWVKAVQARYHGELLWQDKYRALSLYGTWGLIAINSLIFLGSSALRWRSEADRLHVIQQATLQLTQAAEDARDTAHGRGKTTKSKLWADWLRAHVHACRAKLAQLQPLERIRALRLAADGGAAQSVPGDAAAAPRWPRTAALARRCLERDEVRRGVGALREVWAHPRVRDADFAARQTAAALQRRGAAAWQRIRVDPEASALCCASGAAALCLVRALCAR